MNGSADRPATELMLTIRPRAALRSGRNAWVTATAPTTFTSSTCRSSASGTSSSGPAAGMPALFTSPASGAPASARSTPARAAAMLAPSVTSMRTGVTPPRSSAAPSSGRRTVPNTRKPRAARSRALHAPMPLEAPVTTTPPVTWGNLRLPGERRRAGPQARVHVGKRHRRRYRPCAALHRGDADRRHLTVRPQLHYGRGRVLRPLVRLDDERPGALLRPGPLERVHPFARRLRELELHRATLAVHDPFRRAGHDVADCGPVMKSVHQQEGAARRLIVRIGGQLDRDPRRAGERRAGGRGQRARERGGGETAKPRMHCNLRLRVASEMPAGARTFMAWPRAGSHP